MPLAQEQEQEKPETKVEHVEEAGRTVEKELGETIKETEKAVEEREIPKEAEPAKKLPFEKPEVREKPTILESELEKISDDKLKEVLLKAIARTPSEKIEEDASINSTINEIVKRLLSNSDINPEKIAAEIEKIGGSDPWLRQKIFDRVYEVRKSFSVV